MNFTYLFNDFEDSYSILEQDAGYILMDNLQDVSKFLSVYCPFISADSDILLKRSVRSGLSLAGWKPRQGKAQAQKQAVEFWEFDWVRSSKEAMPCR